MWSQVTIAAPATEPIEAATAKAHARIDGTDEDALVALYIAAARDHVERYCGVRLAARTGVALLADSFYDFDLLPEAPVSAISGITYIDTDGATQTLSTDVYAVRNEGLDCSIVLKYNQTWPPIQFGSRITVTVNIGSATVPSAVTAALLLMFGHLYANRESVSVGAGIVATEMPMAVADLLVNHRRYA
jgi:uncharacterized phiE125 gp8 family phage protein